MWIPFVTCVILTTSTLQESLPLTYMLMLIGLLFQFNQDKDENIILCQDSGVCITDMFVFFGIVPMCFYVAQQARAEQEEEFISNTLFKKIQALQKEKETLAVNYEKEEEFLTNELSRKLMQVSDRAAPLVEGGLSQVELWSVY